MRRSCALGKVMQLEGELQEGLYAERVAMTEGTWKLLFSHPEKTVQEVVARGRVNPWPKKRKKEQHMDKL